MRFDSLRELVERITRETGQRSAETSERIQATRDGILRKGMRAHDYEDGVRECWRTILRLNRAKDERTPKPLKARRP